MAEMRDFFHEAEQAVLSRLPHHAQPASPQERPQETTMTTTRLGAARDAISAIADNPLIDAIAEAGIGLSLTPAQVQLVVALVRSIEHRPDVLTYTTPPPSFSAAPPPATQVQPQNT